MLKRSPAPMHPKRAVKKSASESGAHAPAPSVNHPEPSHDEPVPEPQSERTGYSADTSLKLYLREIGKVKLLSPEDEVQLAKHIRKGDKKAREQMIKANLRLVVKIARDYEGL